MASKENAPQLQYDAGGASPLGRRAYRLLLIMTLLTLVNTIILASVLLGPQLTPWLKSQWSDWQIQRAERKQRQAELALQQQCLTYSVPAGKVVYEEDPAEGAKLLAGGAEYEPAYGLPRGGYPNSQLPPGWQPPVRIKVPAPLIQYRGTMSFGGGGSLGLFSSSNAADEAAATLFLHERTAPAGTRRLVVVRLRFGTEFGSGNNAGSEEIVTQKKWRVLDATTYSIAGKEGTGPELKDERSLGLLLPDTENHIVARIDESRQTGSPDDPPPVVKLDYGRTLRFFAGQADPKDPSHFTLPYQLDGKDGVIDGWLKDDGILLRPQTGRMTFDNAETTWELSPAAESAPALPAGPSR